jgi:hypothetical protein
MYITFSKSFESDSEIPSSHFREHEATALAGFNGFVIGRNPNIATPEATAAAHNPVETGTGFDGSDSDNSSASTTHKLIVGVLTSAVRFTRRRLGKCCGYGSYSPYTERV